DLLGVRHDLRVVGRGLVRVQPGLLEQRLVVPEHGSARYGTPKYCLPTVASARWPGLSALLYGSALTYLVMFSSAFSCENVGTSMSLSPTTSGGEPARMAVASWLVSSLGGVRCSTTLRFLWVALNSLTRALA